MNSVQRCSTMWTGLAQGEHIHCCLYAGALGVSSPCITWRYTSVVTVDEVIGRNVHHLMWEKRIKQQAVYEAIGVTRGSLHRRLRGETPWTARDIEATARILDVDPGRLFRSSVTGESLNAISDESWERALREWGLVSA